MPALMPTWMQELTDWFGPERLLPQADVIRVEDYLEDRSYVLRAEIPGVDPDKDITVQVQDGVLRVDAERRQETHDEQRSEFRYGALHRSLTLPRGADVEHITAKYDNGILTVTVPTPEPVEPSGKVIPITAK